MSRREASPDAHRDATTWRKTVGARELKTRLGTYLRHVREGATLIVTERGIPVAELRPLDLAAVELEGALRGLVARGLVGGEIRERPSLEAFEPVAHGGPPLSEAIVAEREDRF